MKNSIEFERSGENFGSAKELASILRWALWAEPAKVTDNSAISSWYQRHIYGAVIARRLERIRAWRNPEPWLSIQVLLEKLNGEPNRKSYLRGEGLPGGITYSEGFESIGKMEFALPFIYVAGYPRSGTTSLQNLTLRSFKEHLPRGEWNVPPHSLRLWWYPKHEVSVATAISELGAPLARVFLAMRPLEDALASYSAYSGDYSKQWIESQIPNWFEMAELATSPNVLAIPFSTWQDNSPRNAALLLEQASNIAATHIPNAATNWNEIHFEGTSPDMMALADKSHLPNENRKAQILNAHRTIKTVCSADERDRARRLYIQVEKNFAALLT